MRPDRIRRQEKTSVITRILPIHGAARTPFLGARVILTRTAVEHKPRSKVDLAARAFGLTPAEARLASIIGKGSALNARRKNWGLPK